MNAFNASHSSSESPPAWPKVSILIAARNEAANIERCLASICGLSYPPDKFEVLLGDDGSTDGTGELALRYMQDAPNFRLVLVSEQVAGLQGKANVLAQLAHFAQGDFLLITDADTAVPTTWVQAMLAEVAPETGVLTGCTLVESGSVWGALQCLDWTYAQSVIAAITACGIPVTAMGNNMLIRHVAYRQLGGYEQLPFSVTEDLRLFQHVVAAGWGFKNSVKPGHAALTLPAPDLTRLILQRTRWMSGALQLSPPFVLALFLLALSGFWLALLAYWSPYLALGLLLTKMGVQSAVMLFQFQKLRYKKPLRWLWLYEPFFMVVYPLMVFHYYTQSKLVWKGRAYGK